MLVNRCINWVDLPRSLNTSRGQLQGEEAAGAVTRPRVRAGSLATCALLFSWAGCQGIGSGLWFLPSSSGGPQETIWGCGEGEGEGEVKAGTGCWALLARSDGFVSPASSPRSRKEGAWLVWGAGSFLLLTTSADTRVAVPTGRGASVCSAFAV